MESRNHGTVFACYQRLLRARNLMDFDDMLAKASWSETTALHLGRSTRATHVFIAHLPLMTYDASSRAREGCTVTIMLTQIGTETPQKLNASMALAWRFRQRISICSTMPILQGLLTAMIPGTGLLWSQPKQLTPAMTMLGKCRLWRSSEMSLLL